MTDRKTILRLPHRLERVGPPRQQTDMRLALAAIVAITRRDWLSPVPAAYCAADDGIRQSRSAHPLIRYSLDARRHIAWRARIGRQAWIQTVLQFAKLNDGAEGATQIR